MSGSAAPLRILGAVNNYDWGMLGLASAVAQLYTDGQRVAIEASKPYSEYWFGTHPSGPARMESGELLSEWLAGHPESRGTLSTPELPFLLKVLSVGKALSVQAHPDKALAAKLHASMPESYKDDNHKPEMALALTPFEAMCGFRAEPEIAGFLDSVPELRGIVGEEVASRFSSVVSAGGEGVKPALKELFTAYMSAPPSVFEPAVLALAARLGGSAPPAASALTPGPIVDLLDPNTIALRLCGQYPGDIGVFAPYLLNTVALRPGQAIFLAANEPHAYLAGDCIECMACSDNVVRAGLTPKFKDVSTLCSMLTYSTGLPDVLTGSPAGPFTRLYKPPVPEFVIERITVPAGNSESLSSPPCPAIILVVEGAVTFGDVAATRGASLLQLPGSTLTCTATEPGYVIRVYTNEL